MAKAKDRNEWQSWKVTNTDSYEYWNRMEECVNDAVLHTANALTWVITEVESYTCGNDLSNIKQNLNRYFSTGAAFMLLSYLGMYLVQYFLKATLIVSAL